MAEGWKCPVCGAGVAPTEKRCDHGGAYKPAEKVEGAKPLSPQDLLEQWRKQQEAVKPPKEWQGWPQQKFGPSALCHCLPGTICGNAACPHRMIVTC